MDNLLKKVISVTSIVEGNGKTVVVDQDGKKFNVWHTKKDGSPSKASITMQQYQVKVGSTIEVSYTEEDFELNGKQLKTKRVMSFAPANQAPHTSATFSAPIRSEDDTVVGQIATHYVAARLAFGTPIDEVSKQLPQLFKLARETKHFQFPHAEAIPNAKVFATQSSDDEIAVEDIPF